MEFPRFCVIFWNSLLAGDKGTDTAYFSQIQAAIEN